VLVENVPGLLSSGMGEVLGDLAASGYDAEWDCVAAANVGAPHLRYRVFIVAYAQGVTVGARLRQGQPSSLGGQRSGDGGRTVPDPEFDGLEGILTAWSASGPTLRDREWWATEPNVGRVAHGVPSRVDRLRALGNAVVPAVAEAVGRLIVAHEEGTT
jgi:DNA (cytosine-5)-methyltransferase 1